MSLAAFVVAATLFIGASAQTPFYQGTLYLQPGNNSNKCMQAANYNGAPVVLADCATGGSEDQQWTFSGGSVKIHGNKCLVCYNPAKEGRVLTRGYRTLRTAIMSTVLSSRYGRITSPSEAPKSRSI